MLALLATQVRHLSFLSHVSHSELLQGTQAKELLNGKLVLTYPGSQEQPLSSLGKASWATQDKHFTEESDEQTSHSSLVQVELDPQAVPL